jgi:hypothetical protein
MNSGEKVSGGLVIAGSHSSEFFELADEILDEMARFVNLFVVHPHRLRGDATAEVWRLLCVSVHTAPFRAPAAPTPPIPS